MSGRRPLGHRPDPDGDRAARGRDPKLNELLTAGAIDQAAYARAVEDANDRALHSSQAWTDGATRFLKDYVAESQDAASATEHAFANAFGGAEDALVGFIASGKLEFQSLADSILADLARMTVRQTVTAPLAGTLQSALAGGGLFGLFHEGGVVGERPPALRYADAAILDYARATTAAASPARGSCPTRSRSSPGAASWSCLPSGSCVRRRRHASSGRSPWWSMSPRRMRAPFGRARARSRPTWRGRSIGRAGTDDLHVCQKQKRLLTFLREETAWTESTCPPGASGSVLPTETNHPDGGGGLQIVTIRPNRLRNGNANTMSFQFLCIAA